MNVICFFKGNVRGLLNLMKLATKAIDRTIYNKNDICAWIFLLWYWHFSI